MDIRFLYKPLYFLLIISACASPQRFSKETDQPLTLAVLELEANGVSKANVQKISEAMNSEISTIIKKRGIDYNVIEYSQINRILKEYEISEKGAVSQVSAIDLGKMLQVDRIVIGSVGFVGNTYSIIARIVDVETGAVLNSADRQLKGSPDKFRASLVPKAARDLLKNNSHYSRAFLEKMNDSNIHTLAVLDFDAKGISSAEAEVLSDKLRATISSEVNKRDNTYLLIERAQMENIIKLLNVNNPTVVESGKILKADRVVIGSIERDDSNAYYINMKIVDIETGKIIKDITHRHKGSVDDLLVSVIPEAGRELLYEQ